MADLALWLSRFTGFVCMPMLAIAAVALHYRLREKSTLILAIGLIVTVVGLFLDLFSPLKRGVTFDQVLDAVMERGRFPMSWYLGDIIFFAGVSVTCLGFVWFSWSLCKPKGRDI